MVTTSVRRNEVRLVRRHKRGMLTTIKINGAICIFEYLSVIGRYILYKIPYVHR